MYVSTTLVSPEMCPEIYHVTPNTSNQLTRGLSCQALGKKIQECAQHFKCRSSLSWDTHWVSHLSTSHLSHSTAGDILSAEL